MRILFYNHTGQVGGAERLLLTILSRLDRANFDPILVCPAQGTLKELAVDTGVPVETVRLLEARFTWRVDFLLRYLKSFVEVIRELRKKIVTANPNLIHANSVRAGLVATMASVGLGKPVVWHVHDLLPRHPFNPLIRAVARLAPHTQVMAVAQASGDRFVGHFVGLRRRLTVIRNGVDARIFRQNRTASEKIRSELTLAQSAPVIGMIGRITPSKGQLELLRVFPRVLHEFPNATLLIAGAPAFNEEHEYLETLNHTVSELGLSDRVRMLGPRNDVAAIMQALDLLVINSVSEACCLVALEAMACGTPVLATRVGGTPEIIEHQNTGWLIPVNDENALATSIIELIGRPALRARLAEKGKQHVGAHFSINGYMRRIQDFYLKNNVIDIYSLTRSRTVNAITAQHDEKARP